MIRVVVSLLVLIACAPTAWADEALSPEERHNVTMRILEGNWEYLAQIEPHAKSAEDAFPFAVRDLWWRPDPTAAARYEEHTKRDDLWGARYRWLFAPAPRGAYPLPEMGEFDPWPELGALIKDRIRRESRGPEGLPDDSPIRPLVDTLDALDAGPGLDEPGRHRLWDLANALDQQSVVVDGYEPTAEELAAVDEAAGTRLRNMVLAIASLLALVGWAGFTAWRASRRQSNP